jgi:hypothetical protein
VVAYRLARLLGISRLSYPVGYYRLGPKATEKFKAMVDAAPEREPEPAERRRMVLADFKANPTGGMLGIYRQKPKSKFYTASVLGREGKLDTTTGLAQEIQASGRMPDDRKISLEGVKGGQPAFPGVPTERRVELARQLSSIFVVDMLLGQWDRFWNNLEATGDRTWSDPVFIRPTT